jgi:hypothetical protein
MATKTVLIDDLDGNQADVTIAFVIQGNRYSIDLSTKNAKKFWETLDPYIKAAKNLDGERETAIEAEVIAVEQRQSIREWARKQGFDVSDRGRIPQSVEEAFKKAQKR